MSPNPNKKQTQQSLAKANENRDAFNIHEADDPLKMEEIFALKKNMYNRYKGFKLLGALSLILLLVVPYYFSKIYLDKVVLMFSSELKFVTTSISLVSIGVFYGLNLIYLILYKKEHPFFEQFKDNELEWPWKTDPDFSSKFWKCLRLVVINKLVFGGGFAALMFVYFKFPIEVSSAAMPSFIGFVLQISFMIVTEDFAFYWSHRTMHTPYIYRKVHKVHHEFYDCFSLCSEYAHPVEFLFGNVIPVFLGTILLGGRAHILSLLIFLVFRLTITVEAHGGYEFPWAIRSCLPFYNSTRYHNYHHLKNIGNFGSSYPIWDSIFGTNSNYYKDLLKYGIHSKLINYQAKKEE